MIKLTFCIYRLPHMSQEEFLSYWLDTHGPLVKKHASTLNVRRYLQQHPADDPINEAIKKSRGTPEGFDGVAEVWFDSVDSMMEPANTEAGRAAMKAIREDESRFIDSERSPVWVGQDHVLVGD